MIIYSAFRNKKYIVYTILITLLFILSYIFCLNYNYYDYQINDVLGEKEVNRGLILYYEEDNIEDLISESKCTIYYHFLVHKNSHLFYFLH